MSLFSRLTLLCLLTACTAPSDKGGGGALDTSGDDGNALDGDGDGFLGEEDCNDLDSSVNPGVAEICDGIDNNCDGQIDEGLALTWYEDSDGDGFGDPGATVEACSSPTGAVSNGTDCDDSSDQTFPGAPEVCDGMDNDCDGSVDDGEGGTWYTDSDGDGYGDPDSAVASCDGTGGLVDNAEDCDDEDELVSPEAEEICDEVDNNCDGDVDEDVGLTWYEDRDGDGYGVTDSTVEACSEPAGYAWDPGDCDDSDPSFHPGADESDCTDANDYNCDGSVAYADADGDGWAACTECDDRDDDVYPGADEVCNGIDDDCDGDTDDADSDLNLSTATTWYEDDDSDGYGDASDTALTCTMPSGFVANDDDCNDATAAISPADAEVCNDFDDDCDGLIDDLDSSLSSGTSIFYDDDDSDGYGDATDTTRACDQPLGYVSNDDDCNDGSAAISPADAEVCNGADDDCDGLTDDADPSISSTVHWYDDDDGDGYGDIADSVTSCTAPAGYVSNDDDCNDTSGAISPADTEVCNDLDDDCDGLTDDLDSSLSTSTATRWYDDDDADLYGDAADSLLACDLPSGYVANDDDCNDTNPAISPGDSEICNDLDDDCDGLTDDADGSLSVSSTSTFYDDDDSDGYGDPADLARACDAPAGYVSNDDDCDDRSASISPADAEICNDLDDDCDGRIDDADSSVTGESTWYDDDDGDSYGDPLIHIDSCDAPAGWVGNDDDCDDSDATVYPGSSETWFDGVDSDCDGLEDPHPCDSLPGATTVSTASCTVSRSGTWSVATEWSTDPADGYTYTAGPTYTHIMAAPVVGQTNDDTGDGIIDGHDTPDIIYSTFASSSYSGYGYLRVVNGDDGSIRYSVTSVVYSATTHYVSGASSVAIGDLENDGEPDILVSSYGSKVIALNADDGTVKWVSSASCGSARCAPAIGDLDGDGEAEVVAGTAILSASGTSLATLPYDGDNRVTIADMNDDGDMEIFTGNGVYDETGAQIWRYSTATGNSAVGNFDSDANIEVVFEYSNYIYLLNHTGSMVWRTLLSGSTNGAPCVADFDGDGLAEVAAASSTRITMLDSDGTVDWYYTIDDSSSYSTGCSAFDFDGDGDSELVYADESIFYIFNGATGALLYSTSSHASGTIWEYPVVADVDNDGQAEVVLVSNDYTYSGWDGIHVLGEANGLWASARQSFNQYAYIPDHINDDMTIPAAPGAAWADWGTRSQAPYGVDANGAADLQAYVLGVCETCRSTGYLDVYVSVENRGDVLAPAATSVALYALSGTSTTLIAADEVGIPVLPGERSAPLTFTIHESAIGSSGLRAVADDDGTGADTVTECDETDNTDDWNTFECL